MDSVGVESKDEAEIGVMWRMLIIESIPFHHPRDCDDDDDDDDNEVTNIKNVNFNFEIIFLGQEAWPVTSGHLMPLFLTSRSV